MKPADWQDYPYPFIYGQGDQNLFPLSAWRECSRQSLSVNAVKDWSKDRFTDDDVIVISAQRFRTQEHNRRDALERLSELIEQARIEPKVRRPTKPTRASKQRRLEHKQQRGQIKRSRGTVKDFD